MSEGNDSKIAAQGSADSGLESGTDSGAYSRIGMDFASGCLSVMSCLRCEESCTALGSAAAGNGLVPWDVADLYSSATRTVSSVVGAAVVSAHS